MHGKRFHIKGVFLCICSDRFARRASKPVDAQTGLADIVDAPAGESE